MASNDSTTSKNNPNGHSWWFSGDKVLWVIIAMMAVISVLVVYSSTAKMAYDANTIRSTSDFLKQQFLILFIGITLLFVAHKINYHIVRHFTPAAYWISIGLTLLAYALGVTTNGAARWIPIGGFQFQPSEALKVATILNLARALTIRQNVIDRLRIVPSFNPFLWALPGQKKIWREGTMPILFPVFLACGVIVSAHTSSAVLLFVASFVVMIIGRVKWSELGKIILIVVAAGAMYMMVGAGRSETASNRVSTWIELLTTDRTKTNINDLTDTERSMIAIHNGGVFGEGAGHSAMRVEMIHPESDYAFAFFVEEYGLILSLIVLMLYLWLFFRAMEISRECRTAFPALMVLGLAVMITCQALLHIMVTVNLTPETGQTLPLISRGGSSLFFTSIALGLILSVSRQNREVAAQER
ncbi:MAG: FtsW/RodA/SpoVE family cell cycle protein [Rikenellaceae bacterium]